MFPGRGFGAEKFKVKRPAVCQEVLTESSVPFDYSCARRDTVRLWVPLSSISPILREYVVALEDAQFYSHNGIDTGALFDAFKHDLKVGKFARGGSTITQQLVKNLYLTKEKTISRKVQEVSLSLDLEKNLSKKEILELYLNTIEWGPGVYGAEAASRLYFEKHANEISEFEAWMLALMIPNPKQLNLWFQPKAMPSLKKRATKFSRNLKAIKHFSESTRKERLQGFLDFLAEWKLKKPTGLWAARQRFPAVWILSPFRLMDLRKDKALVTKLDPLLQGQFEKLLLEKTFMSLGPAKSSEYFVLKQNHDGGLPEIRAMVPVKKVSMPNPALLAEAGLNENEFQIEILKRKP